MLRLYPPIIQKICLASFPLCFSTRKPKGHWENVDNQLNLLESIGKKLNIQHPSDWATIPQNIFDKEGGKPLLREYNSFYNMLCSLYPNNKISPFLFPNLPKQFLSGNENHKLILNLFKERFWIVENEQWFKIPNEFFKKQKLHSIIKQYSSLRNLLETIYPEINWIEIEKNHFNSDNPWKNEIKRLPPGFWNDIDNQRKFLDYVAKKMNITKNEDWVNINTDKIKELGGRQLLRKYSTFFEVLKNVYPDKNFLISEIRPRVSFNYWESKENQKKFLDDLQIKLKLKNVKDLQQITVRTLQDNGGSRILRYYDSFYELLCTIYPEEYWNPYDFKIVPRGYWTDDKNIKDFVSIVAKKYKVSKMEDWYRISDVQFRDCGGSGLLRKYGSKQAILQLVFPDFTWNRFLLSRRDKRSTQRWLFCSVQELYPGIEIVEDYILNYVDRDSACSIELDVYIPEFSIALEYQGEHHYYDIPSFGNIEMYTRRDEEKVRLCKENNIKLIVVPYWWDGSTESLQKLINGEEIMRHE